MSTVVLATPVAPVELAAPVEELVEPAAPVDDEAVVLATPEELAAPVEELVEPAAPVDDEAVVLATPEELAAPVEEPAEQQQYFRQRRLARNRLNESCSGSSGQGVTENSHATRIGRAGGFTIVCCTN